MLYIMNMKPVLLS